MYIGSFRQIGVSFLVFMDIYWGYDHIITYFMKNINTNERKIRHKHKKRK